MNGSRAERPVLSKVLEHLRAGDVLVIWKLDRLGRSLKHLIEVVNELMTRKIGLKSLNDPIDTTTPQGRLIFNLFASLSEFERDVIRERTQAGLSAARARGRNGGRPKGVPSSAEPTACAAETLYQEGKLSTLRPICKHDATAQSPALDYRVWRSVRFGINAHEWVSY
jgi:DNA invertase Pin-like site-specific DNA recombinase